MRPTVLRLATLMLAAAPATLHAQTIAGLVRDQGTRAPTSHVIAVLIGPDSGEVARDTTHSTGTFTLDAKPGRYTLAFATFAGTLLGRTSVELVADSTMQAEFVVAEHTEAYLASEVDSSARPVQREVDPVRDLRASLPPGVALPSAAVIEKSMHEPRKLLYTYTFVVDSTGMAEPTTLEFDGDVDAAARSRVLKSLVTRRFIPAVKDGHHVRQLVETRVERGGELRVEMGTSVITLPSGSNVQGPAGGRRSP